MTPGMWTIIGVGIALAGLLLNGQRGLGQRMDRLDARMDRLETGHSELRERMAHLEGLLDGLREAITGHRAA